ncbi:hypothetical protein BY458DRAFT_488537 [Sporodiniella umbellata]|nr:hypothetical protein BY458DRAFT_488537 [Sporodiniella umbellata]
MTMGFFNTQDKKTNIDLKYNAIVLQIKINESVPCYLNIEEFLEQEKVDLGTQRAFFQEKERTANVSISNINQKNVRVIAENFVNLNNQLPEMKSRVAEGIQTVNHAFSVNKQTIQLIDDKSIKL